VDLKDLSNPVSAARAAPQGASGGPRLARLSSLLRAAAEACYASPPDALGSEEIAVLEAVLAQAMTRLAGPENHRHGRQPHRPLAKTTAADVTARVPAERVLGGDRQLLQSVIDAASDAIYAKDLEGRYWLVNEQVGRDAGRPIEEILGRDDSAIFPPETAAAINAGDAELLRTGETVTVEFHAVDTTGRDRWFFTTKSPLLDPDGRRVGLVGISRDVTERKAQERIAEARSRLLSLSLTCSLDEMLGAMLTEAEDLTSSHIGFYHLVDEDQVTLTLSEWSPRTKATFGATGAAGSQHPIDEAGVLADCVRLRKAVVDNDYASLASRKGRPPGHSQVVRELVVPVFRGDLIRAIVGVGNKATDYGEHDIEAVTRLADLAFDIAERMRAENEMRLSERLYRTLLETAPFAIGVHRDGRGLFANEAHRAMFGYSDPAMLTTLGPEDMLAPASVPAAREMLRRRSAGEEPDREYELTGRRQDGTTFPMLVRHASVMLPDGPATILFHFDLTEVRRAQEALRQSEEKFRVVSEHSLSGIAVIDGDVSLYVNPAFAQICGYPQEQMIGREVFASVHPEDRDRVRESIRQRMDGAPETVTYEARIIRPDGEVRHVLGFGSRVELGGQPVILMNLLDLTDRKRLEEDLRQSQKLEALGRLAGGVAHDFNNLLTAIGGYARLLRDELAVGNSDPEYTLRIIEAADRAAALTSRLLAFSGRQARRRQPIVLADSVTGLLPILKRVVPERIEMFTSVRPGPSVLADATEIDQILLNLVLNAADAISGPGRIMIETGLVVHDEAFVRLNQGAKLGAHVRLTVGDTGIGMDAATLARMYEPFFTTKPKGSGTGLGLATVYGIVEGMGGCIEVTSVPGVGTTFRIDLPTSGEASELLPQAPKRDTSGNERVLLVEDEPDVLTLSQKILERLGYQVVAVQSARDALAWPATDFDLVVTDVVMPGMDGPDMVRRLRQANPTLPVLYVSGYQPREDMTAALREPATWLLAKPFTRSSLGSAVRAALGDADLDAGAANDS
jgi:two-component system cell cycle sensor histidine kinase/response regulator CckA